MLDLESIFGEPVAVQPGTVPVTDATLAAPRFADWIRRPDATGRMGWERPGLPEGKRWWAERTFDALPEAGGLSNPANQQPERCYWCGGAVFWRSIHEVLVCGNCHPPAVPSLLAEWVNIDKSIEGVDI